MTARKLYNYITYVYSIYMYNPNLLKILDELDKFTIKEAIKYFCYSISYEFINKNRDIDYNLDFTNKTGKEFCNDTFSYIKTFLKNDLNTFYSYLPSSKYDKFLEKIVCFTDMYRYELIGFFFDSFIDTYKLYTNKLKEINSELEVSETTEERSIELKYCKNEINLLLITDFLTETLNNSFYNIFNMFITYFELDFDRNFTNIGSEINISLTEQLTLLKKIGEIANKYNVHKEKIKSYI